MKIIQQHTSHVLKYVIDIVRVSFTIGIYRRQCSYKSIIVHIIEFINFILYL